MLLTFWSGARAQRAPSPCPTPRMTKRPGCEPTALTAEAKFWINSMIFSLQKAKVKHIYESDDIYKLPSSFSCSSFWNGTFFCLTAFHTLDSHLDPICLIVFMIFCLLLGLFFLNSSCYLLIYGPLRVFLERLVRLFALLILLFFVCFVLTNMFL